MNIIERFALTVWALFLIWVFGVVVACLGTPCQYEDSNNCYWDAKHRGNGEGRPFVDIVGHVFYF